MKDTKDIEILLKLKRYYVYVCYVNDEPVYVGKGKGKRCLHCVSGRSHNKKLNQALLNYGSKAFKIHIVYNDLVETESLRLERKLIKYFVVQGYTLFNCDPETQWFVPDVTYHFNIEGTPIPKWVTEEIN